MYQIEKKASVKRHLQREHKYFNTLHMRHDGIKKEK